MTLIGALTGAVKWLFGSGAGFLGVVVGLMVIGAGSTVASTIAGGLIFVLGVGFIMWGEQSRRAAVGGR
ncbi:hypothetical protein [Halomarina oriensis]|uniref:hypothetical protein n=1 Tax=Halomarina oriensis TaxID=671145 RepID=UPI00130384FF|nr:hypothetical protein [Halomarina oriensis]